MPWAAFDSTWFDRHQAALLAALNGRATGRALRRVLRIAARGPLAAIAPDAYEEELADGRRRLVVHTHPKFAKRLYHAARPLWWSLHGWDLFADRWTPAYSAGLSTLTQFASAGAGGDGRILHYMGPPSADTDFAALRETGGASNAAYDTEANGAVQLGAGDHTDKYYVLSRAVFVFSYSLAAAQAIDDGSLYLSRYGGQADLGECPLALCRVSGSSSPIAVGDWANFQTTEQWGQYAWASWTGAGYQRIPLNAAARAYLATVSTARVGALLQWDLDGSIGGSWVSRGTNYYWFYLADQAGTGSDPYLELIYFPAGRDRRPLAPRADLPVAHLGL